MPVIVRMLSALYATIHYLLKNLTAVAAGMTFINVRKSDGLLQVVVFSFVGSPLMFLVKYDWDIHHSCFFY